MFVPVETAATIAFGIVQVDDPKVLQAHMLIELPEGFRNSLLCAELVTRRERMTGVKAYPDSLLRFDPVHDSPYVLETASHAVLLTRGILKDQQGLVIRRGKGGKSRLVAISDQLCRYLQDFLAWKRINGEPMDRTRPLFMSERYAAMTRSAVHRIWKSTLKAAQLPTRWGVHATRHSYAVEVYRKTRDLRLTQRLLGHSSPVVTTVYANLLDDDVRRGVEQIWAA